MIDVGSSSFDFPLVETRGFKMIDVFPTLKKMWVMDRVLKLAASCAQLSTHNSQLT